MSPGDFDDTPLVARKRARLSCDTCRNRKTKCIMQEGGRKCRYCESAGTVCSTNNAPRKRPFYRVSEEEYNLCMKLLRHFIPDTDFNLETLKRILAQVEDQKQVPPITSTNINRKTTIDRPQLVESRDDVQDKPAESDDSSISLEDTGCMIIDPSGKYRYVDADSSLRFDHAARMARQSRSQMSSSAHDPTVISPFITGMPPATPESALSTSTTKDITDIHFPSREICMQYVTTFFEQVHCIYWIYSPEQFYSQLDRTLEDGPSTCSPSWLCSLYSIFAIASALSVENPESAEAKSSSYYLSIAKNLSVQACDTADSESLRAVVLLSLAFHSSTLSVSSYLTVGVAVRIALSIGLHRNISPKSQDCLERERCRRLWWTIYQLDQEVSMQLGHPFAIVDEALCIQTLFASEQLLDPGRNTPLEFQAINIALVKLKKRISQDLYVIPAQTTRRVCLEEVTSAINDLQTWLEQMPPHLRCNSPIYPSHRRAVYTLHLRYWTTVIHVTRPFLLHSVARPSELHQVKRQRYEELSNTCQDAAEHAVNILRKMLDYRLLSSLLLFDLSCIQELLQVFLLIKYKGGNGPCWEQIQSCMKAYHSMPVVGWTKRNMPEMTALLSEAGFRGNSEIRGCDDQETGKERGVQLLLQNTASAGESLAAQPPSVDPGRIPDLELNFDPAQMDIFDTLDLDMGIFSSMDWPDI